MSPGRLRPSVAEAGGPSTPCIRHGRIGADYSYLSVNQDWLSRKIPGEGPFLKPGVRLVRKFGGIFSAQRLRSSPDGLALGKRTVGKVVHQLCFDARQYLRD